MAHVMKLICTYIEACIFSILRVQLHYSFFLYEATIKYEKDDWDAVFLLPLQQKFLVL